MPAMHLGRAGELWVTSHRQSGQALREGGRRGELTISAHSLFSSTSLPNNLQLFHSFIVHWLVAHLLHQNTVALGGVGAALPYFPASRGLEDQTHPHPSGGDAQQSFVEDNKMRNEQMSGI